MATSTINGEFSGTTAITLVSGRLGNDAVEIDPGGAFVVIGGTDGGSSSVGSENPVEIGGLGKTSADGEFNARLDQDGDGSIGFQNFLCFAAVFGQSVSQ